MTHPLPALTSPTVPRGGDVVDRLLPVLARALDGGPALLPLPDGPSPLRDSIVAALRPDEPLDGDAAAVVPTSGTTGEPRGVLLPAAAVRASADATHARLGGQGCWLLALPATHVAGLMVLARSVVAGTMPVALDLRHGLDPEDFVTASARLGGNLAARRYTALVPAQLTTLLDHGDATAALAGYDAVLLGGSAAPAALVERARESGVNVVTTYGMTETCGGCVYDGVPLDGVDVDIETGGSTSEPADDATDVSADQGRIRLRGPMLAGGYRLRPDLTAEVFVDGWFHTSDTGEFGNGVLQITGRVDDVVISGGVNVPLAAVDAALLTAPGVADAAAVGVDDPRWGQRIVAVVVPDATAATPTLESIRSAVARTRPAAYVPKELLLVQRLPMLPSGKVDRRALADLL